jgi:16S rRNA (guanine966-N2)-methyltransferase
MSEKMRGALFNVLGDISDLTVFDAYGGSGAIAFEAISRGAKSALITEVDQTAAKTITANIKSLGLKDSVRMVRANAASYSQNYPHEHYNIVVCDPPYDDMHPTQIIQLGNNVAKDGLLVISKPTGSADFDLEDLELISKKNYGDGTLVFYRKV